MCSACEIPTRLQKRWVLRILNFRALPRCGHGCRRCAFARFPRDLTVFFILPRVAFVLDFLKSCTEIPFVHSSVDGNILQCAQLQQVKLTMLKLLLSRHNQLVGWVCERKDWEVVRYACVCVCRWQQNRYILHICIFCGTLTVVHGLYFMTVIGQTTSVFSPLLCQHALRSLVPRL